MFVGGSLFYDQIPMLSGRNKNNLPSSTPVSIQRSLPEKGKIAGDCDSTLRWPDRFCASAQALVPLFLHLYYPSSVRGAVQVIQPVMKGQF